MLKVEIWSDIVCPFCYMGKRRFEQGLAQSGLQDTVSIEWKSFQLAPDLKGSREKSLNQFLAEHKQISLAEAEKMNAYVTKMALQDNLEYRLDIAVAANSFDAHRLLHAAKGFGLQNELKEALLTGYFTKGLNLEDHEQLLRISTDCGIPQPDVLEVLQSKAYADDVREDIDLATANGIHAVPFFVFNRKYAISGAQPPEVFQETLQKVSAESNQENPL